LSAIKKLVLSLGLLAFVLPVVSVAGTGTASAGLSARRACTTDNPGTELITANGFRLAICAQVWYPDGPATSARGVVVMHTYKRSGTSWVDSTAQSITLNKAELLHNGAHALYFGQDVTNAGSVPDGANTCRVNGAAGSLISCSVPRTGRVSYYSTAWQGVAQNYTVRVTQASFRDASGQPHTWNDPSSLVSVID
jgi:hypothetical protein